MTKLQSPLALANFVIAQTINDHQPVTNRKLNKLIFLLQGYWLAHHHQPLAAVTFKHDPAGPLKSTVYPHFKFAGSFPLTSQATDVQLVAHPDDDLVLDHPMLSLADDNRTALTEVVHAFNQLPSHQLTNLINHHAILTDRPYTDDELIACYQAVTTVCQH